jgi:hypothetical protein
MIDFSATRRFRFRASSDGDRFFDLPMNPVRIRHNKPALVGCIGLKIYYASGKQIGCYVINDITIKTVDTFLVLDA